MKIFLSSTCYDLTDPRAALEDYLKKSGHQVLLSDRANFPVNPEQHRHNVCVYNAANCDFMIVIIDIRRILGHMQDWVRPVKLAQPTDNNRDIPQNIHCPALRLRISDLKTEL